MVLPEIVPEVVVMVAVPPATAVARPLLLTVATSVFDELQVTCAVISKLVPFVPSKYAPEAANCWVDPTCIFRLAGVTDMEDRVAEVTERVVAPEIVPEVAVMVAVPAATAVARPLLLTFATSVFDELQVTCTVVSWLVPSEYAPEAINCWVSPTGMLGLTGVTDMEERIAEVTMRVVAPEIVPEAAVMIGVPAAKAVARPLLRTVAADVLDERQVTCAVISWLVPSEYAPEAANCVVSPTGMLGLTGVTDMKDRVAEVTVRVVLAEIAPEVALMVAVPAATAVARPLLLTVATDVLDELQVTCVVTSRLVPSEYTPEAANCRVTPTGMLGLTGVTDMEDRVAEVTVRVVLPEIVPEVTVMVAVMVAVPGATVVARPLLLTVATDGLEELQVTCVVISKLVPSEYTPEAANCWVAPTRMLGLAGATDMEDRVAEVTVRVLLAEEIFPEVAVMFVLPDTTAVARPLVLIVATTGFDERQVTCVVISRLVPSE